MNQPCGTSTLSKERLAFCVVVALGRFASFELDLEFGEAFAASDFFEPADAE